MYQVVIDSRKERRLPRQKWMGDSADEGELLSTFTNEALAIEIWRRPDLREALDMYFYQFDANAGGNYEN